MQYQLLSNLHLSAEAQTGCDTVVSACAGWSKPWIAYALATAYHETARTMHPIKESGGPNYFSKYGRDPLKTELGNRSMADALNFYGRGYVMITGYSNYNKFGNLLKIDLVNNPDLALKPSNAALIMRQGMQLGLFTGRGLGHYFVNGTHAEAVQARRVINGQDCAEQIATYFDEFQKAL